MNAPSFSYDDIESRDFSQGKAQEDAQERIPYLPEKNQTWPFDVRVLVNPVATEKGIPCHDAHVHSLQIGGKFVNVPCLRTFGQTCPMCDIRWEALDKTKAMEEHGDQVPTSPNHAEYKRWQSISEMYKQKKQYMFLAAKRNDPKIYIFYAGPALVKAIFGDKTKNTKGALHEIKEFGASIFNPGQPTGWLTVNKTGKKLDTVYSAEATMTTFVENKIKQQRLLEEELHSEVSQKFADQDSLPKISEAFKARMWTEEEMRAFVDSMGQQVPEKIARWVGLNSSSDSAPRGRVDTATFGGANEKMEEFDPF